MWGFCDGKHPDFGDARRHLLELQTSRALFARIFEYLDLVPEITDASDAKDPKPVSAGKTTIGSLIPRLYDVSRGSVRFAGDDVRDLKRVELMSQIGVVSQESYLFHATVRENLQCAKPNASFDEIVDADRIFVIDGGQIIEEGTHEELVEQGGSYAFLSSEQQL